MTDGDDPFACARPRQAEVAELDVFIAQAATGGLARTYALAALPLREPCGDGRCVGGGLDLEAAVRVLTRGQHHLYLTAGAAASRPNHFTLTVERRPSIGLKLADRSAGERP